MPNTPSKIHAGIYMSSFMLVYVIFHIFILRSGFNFQWSITLLDVVSFIVGVSIIVALINYKKSKAINTASRIAVLIIQSLILSMLCQYFLEWVMVQIWKSDLSYLVFYQQSLYARILIMWIVICNISIIHLLSMVAAEDADTRARTMYNEQLVKDAELFKLRQQINPHFLFNTLNSINALVSIDTVKARTMIQQLSSYFRNNINKDEYQWVSLEEELNDIHLYFEIEKVRFGHRLQLEENIDEQALKHRVPPLLLQPLVENAIKYGLYGTTGNIVISLKVYIQSIVNEQKMVVLEIHNPYDPTYKQVSGTGFGLNAISRRLYLLFSRNDLIQTTASIKQEQEELAQFKAVLKIPINDDTYDPIESYNN